MPTPLTGPRILINRGNRKSRGARLLRDALREVFPRTYLLNLGEVMAYDRLHPSNVVINWGQSDFPYNNSRAKLLNATGVERAACKLATFKSFEEFQPGEWYPRFTTDPKVAKSWECDVMLRKVLRGSQGDGIELVEKGSELPRAPLYVEYRKKADEYRVHVGNGAVMDVQQKRKRQEVDNEEVNYQVRNAKNGWVFCRSEVALPEKARTAALAATEALGLEFGAVDLGYNRKQDQVTVYEVNTAPGLEGTTLDTYVAIVRSYL